MINPNQSGNIIHHIEIKAYLDNFTLSSERVSALASSGPVDRVQQDTFFNCRSGRLKLRSSGSYHDLIYYRRQDDYGPKESFYQSARSKNPQALRLSLASAFGIAGSVRKFRRTYRIGQTMINLDKVAGLGEFIEIKTELGEKLTTESAGTEVENLMQALDVDLFQLVDTAYVDLINEKQNATRVAGIEG